MWRENFLMPYVSIIFNLVFNIFLVKFVGLPGVILSSIGAILFIEMPWETAVFFKKYFRGKQKEYWGKVALTAVLAVCLSALCIILYHFIVSFISNLILQIVILLFMCLIVTALVYGPVLFFSQEGKRIKDYMRNLFRKA